MIQTILLLVCAYALAPAAIPAAPAQRLVNGNFEQGLHGWGPYWSRDSSGQSRLEQQRVHAGRQSLYVEHPGAEDWCVNCDLRLSVEAGEIYDLSGWLWTEGEGSTSFCVILYGPDRTALDWSFGGRQVDATDGWRQVRSSFVVPTGATAIVPRIMGNGVCRVWADDLSLQRRGHVRELKVASLPPTLNLENPHLKVEFDTERACFQVTDKRSGQRFQQHTNNNFLVTSARDLADGVELLLIKPDDLFRLTCRLKLEPNQPELTVELEAEGEMPARLAFPSAFASRKGSWLILPVNEGIGYPVDDATLSPMSYHLYGGHGLCMSWWGMTDLKSGMMAIVESPDDAAVAISRQEGLWCLEPQWQPQKGQFGPARRLRYIFFDRGDYVAMCKRYRNHAKEQGILRTLAEKRQRNPHVDALIGAVNVWCWEGDPVETCRQLRAAGIERVLWSNRGQPQTIEQLNRAGILTGRYDIYQDAMNPANFPLLRGRHQDWTSDIWPNGLVIDSRGDWVRGWAVKGKDDQWYPCGVFCDRLAVDYARRRIQQDLADHPYRCRFIDTTTAASWRECYAPDHPMTRSDSKHWRVQLLRLVCDEFNLVTGSETGHDAAVPFVHYFEGMLSLGPYRVPDAGRDMIRPWTEIPERVAKFQTGHYYRLPLWELVYHDCVVAQWYWGDYNNKLPALWDRRDLFNALYGTPPMFMFTPAIWDSNRERFVQSYQTTTPVVRATGYSEMTSHRWLTSDHSVQQTRFANGVTVTVNFGDRPCALDDGKPLAPLACDVDGLPSQPH